MEEIWRPVKNYEGLYEVSNSGNVRSIERTDRLGRKVGGCLLKLNKHKKGYLQVALCKYGKRKQFYVHRLVAQAFIPNPDNLPCVNHIDEDKTNNRVNGTVQNLEWCTYEYNNSYGTAKKRCVDKLSKTVYQYTLSGEFVKEWSSTHSVERELGFRQSDIFNCCTGRQHTAHGFVWRYA